MSFRAGRHLCSGVLKTRATNYSTTHIQQQSKSTTSLVLGPLGARLLQVNLLGVVVVVLAVLLLVAVHVPALAKEVLDRVGEDVVTNQHSNLRGAVRQPYAPCDTELTRNTYIKGILRTLEKVEEAAALRNVVRLVGYPRIQFRQVFVVIFPVYFKSLGSSTRTSAFHSVFPFMPNIPCSQRRVPS